MWQKQIQPSEIDNMNFWQFEDLINRMNQRNKEENEKTKKQQEEQNSTQGNMMPNMKMPQLNSFSPGGFSLPKF